MPDHECAAGTLRHELRGAVHIPGTLRPYVSRTDRFGLPPDTRVDGSEGDMSVRHVSFVAGQFAKALQVHDPDLCAALLAELQSGPEWAGVRRGMESPLYVAVGKRPLGGVRNAGRRVMW